MNKPFSYFNNAKGIAAYHAWHSLLGEIMENGNECEPRGKKIKELIGHQVFIYDGLENIIADPNRKINYKFLVAQWLTTLIGLEDLPILENYMKAISSYEHDGQGGSYPSYGPRLLPQWPFIMQTLTRDPDSRQAVMSIWQPQTEPQRYVPCTLSLQFLIREKKLHTVATMRSSDAWLGLPYDIFNFSMLANCLAAGLSHVMRTRLDVGSLTMNLGSSHLYEPHWQMATSLANAPMGKSIRSPLMTPTIDFPFSEVEAVLTQKKLSDVHLFDIKKIGHPWLEYITILSTETNAHALMMLEGLARTMR